MSRSKRKTQIIGISGTPRAQKKFRNQEHRAKRRLVTMKLITAQYDELPNEKEYGNEWDSPRDGKQWLRDPEPKWMRK